MTGRPDEQDVEVMSLEEFLGERGLSMSVSDYLLDKVRFPHGMTLRQRNQFEKEAEKAEQEYFEKRYAAISEYRELVAEGKIREPSRIETLLRKAQGHEDNPATHAARRTLAKRGVDWQNASSNEILKGEINMDKRFEELKRALFMCGLEDIEDFLGYEIDPEEDKDVTERRMDMVYEQMPEEELEKFYELHGIYKVIGYFMEAGVWSDGVELPPQKCSVILVDSGGKNLNEVGTDEIIRVLSQEMNWYTIRKDELLLNDDLQKIQVAIESTDDYAAPGFYARLVDLDVQNEDGTYGKVVESYRIVAINENGRIDKFDERVFESLDEARAAVLADKGLELVSYDDLVHEAGKGLGIVLAEAVARSEAVKAGNQKEHEQTLE